MTAREILFGIALLSITVNTFAANPSSLTTNVNCENETFSRESSRYADLPLTDLSLVLEDSVLSSAYNDTLEILGTNNRCSEFFGGSRTIDVFNQMIAKVRKDYFSPDIGIRMSGKTENIVNSETSRSYRLFEKVSLNGNGPFYRSKKVGSEPSPQGVGTYAPGTRQVRVLMLLHELGHAVTADDGKWLLPDDGGNGGLSWRNSLKIEKICGEELANLGRVEGKTELAAKAAKVKH